MMRIKTVRTPCGKKDHQAGRLSYPSAAWIAVSLPGPGRSRSARESAGEIGIPVTRELSFSQTSTSSVRRTVSVSPNCRSFAMATPMRAC